MSGERRKKEEIKMRGRKRRREGGEKEEEGEEGTRERRERGHVGRQREQNSNIMIKFTKLLRS